MTDNNTEPTPKQIESELELAFERSMTLAGQKGFSKALDEYIRLVEQHEGHLDEYDLWRPQAPMLIVEEGEEEGEGDEELAASPLDSPFNFERTIIKGSWPWG